MLSVKCPRGLGRKGSSRGRVCYPDLRQAIVQVADEAKMVSKKPVDIPYWGDGAPVYWIAYVKQVIADVYLIHKVGWGEVGKSVRSHVQCLEQTVRPYGGIDHLTCLQRH